MNTRTRRDAAGYGGESFLSGRFPISSLMPRPSGRAPRLIADVARSPREPAPLTGQDGDARAFSASAGPPPSLSGGLDSEHFKSIPRTVEVRAATVAASRGDLPPRQGQTERDHDAPPICQVPGRWQRRASVSPKISLLVGTCSIRRPSETCRISTVMSQRD